MNPIAESTALERWLATHVGYFARRWQRRTNEWLLAEARAELADAQAHLIEAADTFIFLTARHEAMAEPAIAALTALTRPAITRLEDALHGVLVGAACHHRNCAARVAELEGEPFRKGYAARLGLTSGKWERGPSVPKPVD